MRSKKLIPARAKEFRGSLKFVYHKVGARGQIGKKSREDGKIRKGTSGTGRLGEKPERKFSEHSHTHARTQQQAKRKEGGRRLGEGDDDGEEEGAAAIFVVPIFFSLFVSSWEQQQQRF